MLRATLSAVEIPFIEGTKLKRIPCKSLALRLQGVEIPFIEGTKLKHTAIVAGWYIKEVEIPFIEGTKLKRRKTYRRRSQ